MSRVRRIAFIAALLLTLAVPVTPVLAASPAECAAQIQQVQADVTSLGFVNGKDAAQTAAKLGDAVAKLDAGKTADATAKVVDVQTRTEALVATGKLDAVDGAALIGGIDAAIGCIESIPAAA